MKNGKERWLGTHRLHRNITEIGAAWLKDKKASYRHDKGFLDREESF